MDAVKLPARVAAHLELLRKAAAEAQQRYNDTAFVALLGQEVDLRELPPGMRVNIAPDGEVTFAEPPKSNKQTLSA